MRGRPAGRAWVSGPGSGPGLILAATALIVVHASCAVAPGADPDSATRPVTTGSGPALPPPGYGTLRQDAVSVSMRSGDLQIKVTPLMESVLLATAPDTYRRLHGLAESHGPPAIRATGGGAPHLFLVSFFSETPGTTFAPESLNLISRGLRLRPDAVVAVTPSWGERRLEQRETQMAVYAFLGEVDLQSQLVVLYGSVESAEWNVIRPRVEAELARVRARAGGPRGLQSSRSYLEILR